MKASRKDIIAMFIIGLLSLSACNQDIHKPTAMSRAEKIMDENPDSARHLLETLKPKMAKENKATQMYYNLLTVKANDKCYIPHTSDSLMLEVVKYYEHHGELLQLMEAYYYLASVYRDLNESPQSLIYFQKASEINPSNADYRLVGKIYGQICSLDLVQGSYDDATQAAIKSYQAFNKTNDSLNRAVTLLNIGKCYVAKNEGKKAIAYYKIACNKASILKNRFNFLTIQNELAGLYIQTNSLDSAKNLLAETGKQFEKLPNDIKAQYCVLMGHLYYKICPDSAITFYKKAKEIGNIYVQESSNKSLYEINLQKGLKNEALRYANAYLGNRDSVDKITQTEGIKRIESLYNYNRLEKEKSYLMIENERNKSMLLLVILIALIVSFVGLYIFRKEKKKKQFIILQQEKINYIHQQREQISQKQIERNLIRINQYKKEAEMLAEKDNALQKEILSLKSSILEDDNNRILSALSEQERKLILFHHSDIYQTIIRLAKDRDSYLNSEDWNHLKEEVNLTFDDFSIRLTELLPSITEIEMHICLLIKIKIPISEIPHLILRAKSTAANIRERLFYKIHSRRGSTTEMDEFIEKF